ncbi:MAG: S-adenosylmethionine/S-adenosylhomocysteine transporter [Chlamydiae bacterium]|nr:S-adenosylmethionine/S-adenosylhomocysteine transporter [Chlamydiota bacterium]
MILILLNFFLWSTVFPLGKGTLDVTSPLFLTATRMLFAAVLLLGFLGLTRAKSFKINVKQFIGIGLLGFFNIYLVNILEFWSLQYLSSAKVCFLYGLSPFLTAFLSLVHFKEKMTTKKALGLGLGFLAFLPILFFQSGTSQSSVTSFLPELAMVGAVVFSCYGWILLRSLVKKNVAFSMANGTSMLIGGLFALVHSYFVDTWNPLPMTNTIVFAKGLILMTLISNVICYNLYGYLLKKYTATLLSFAGLLSPIFASINAYFILNEPMQPLIFFCTGFILFALWIIYSEELKLGYIEKSKRALEREKLNV